jgi:hypothetical protein
MVTAYLAHSTLSQDKGIVLQRKLECLGIEVFNPFIEVEQDTESIDMVVRELDAIARSDILVAICDGQPESYGTPMEVFWSSYILHHPTFILYPMFEGRRIHPWLDSLTWTYNTEEELLEAIERFIK